MKENLPVMVQGLQNTARSGANSERQRGQQGQQGSVYHSNDNVGTGGVHYPSQSDGVQ